MSAKKNIIILIGLILFIGCALRVNHLASNNVEKNISYNWWEEVAAVKIVTLKQGDKYSFAHPISIEPKTLNLQLDTIKAEGFQAIEIFAPSAGLYAYNGLDPTDHYNIDSYLGDMDDFRELVDIVHQKGLVVTVFYNIGYFSLESPDWIRACKEPNSLQAKWFWWADNASADPPQLDTYFNWSKESFGEDDDTWGWQYSNLADRYYWSRWKTQDKNGNWVGLPQNNWMNPEWPEEAARIIKHWMDTGIDGMIIDAPIFYAGCTWEKNKKYITGIISSYSNKMVLSEAARHVPWIVRGNYNSMIDYGLHRWNDRWNWDNNSIEYAIDTGDPRPIEQSLHSNHDVIVSAGGSLYKRTVSANKYNNVSKKYLYVATLAAIGDIVAYGRTSGSPEPEETWILKTKNAHKALHQLASRKKLRTNSDDKYFAFIKTAKDRTEQILTIINYQNSTQSIIVDLENIFSGNLLDLKNNSSLKLDGNSLKIELPAYGYKFFKLY